MPTRRSRGIRAGGTCGLSAVDFAAVRGGRSPAHPRSLPSSPARLGRACARAPRWWRWWCRAAGSRYREARSLSRAAASSMPVMSPMDGSSGVVGVFRLVIAPERASRICRSVKVPPMSTAMRTGGTSLARHACSRRDGVRRAFRASASEGPAQKAQAADQITSWPFLPRWAWGTATGRRRARRDRSCSTCPSAPA